MAKAINRPLTEGTVYTQFAQLIGTPLYMSPEQAELTAQHVGTRSDVYSLGVLLYELLTGSTPFDKQTFKDAGFDEMRRTIRDDEPPKPSARLSTLEAGLSTIWGNRGSDPRRLTNTSAANWTGSSECSSIRRHHQPISPGTPATEVRASLSKLRNRSAGNDR